MLHTIAHLRAAVLVPLLVAGAVGCNDSKRAAPTPGEAAAEQADGPSDEPSLGRRDGVPWRSLADEAGRAELVLTGPGDLPSGLMIDFGTIDQHKYTRGGWATGWGESGHDGVSFTTVSESEARLDVTVGQPVRQLVARVRARVPGHRVWAELGDTRLPGHTVPEAWTTVRIAIPEPLVSPGRQTFTLHVTQAGAVEFDWLFLDHGTDAASAPPEPGPRIAPMSMGGRPRRALQAPSARSYRWYLVPHPDEYLVFDYGSKVGAGFAVFATVDGGRHQRLFTATGDDRWRPGAVELGRFAGRAVQLELRVTGGAGNSGWGEPALMRKRGVAPPARNNRADGVGRPKNVVVIVIDTARADAFGPFADAPIPPVPGAAHVDTPVFDRLATHSTVFTSAYNNANWTKPSVASTLSGVYPSTHGASYRDSFVPAELQLLPQYLRGRGFATGAFVANGYISKKFGFDNGWGILRNYIREKLDSQAERVYGDALAWLAGRKGSAQPFLLYIQTIDPHVEYRVPERFTRTYFPGRYTGVLGPSVTAAEQRMLSERPVVGTRDSAWLRALYYGEISYHDEYLGEFLAALSELGFADDTLLVVTNDHGEELGERGHFGHGHSLHQELVRAPLLLRFPGLFPPGARIPTVVEHVDVAPTIVDALGLPPMVLAEGQSLLPLVGKLDGGLDGELDGERGTESPGGPGVRPGYAISEFGEHRRALHIARYSYQRGRGDDAVLFNLDDDPGERVDIAGTHPIARRLCEVYLGEGLAVPNKRERLRDSARRRRLHAPRLDMEPALQRQFEALGYFGGGDPAGRREPPPR